MLDLLSNVTFKFQFVATQHLEWLAKASVIVRITSVILKVGNVQLLHAQKDGQTHLIVNLSNVLHILYL